MSEASWRYLGCSEAGHRLALQALLQKLLVTEALCYQGPGHAGAHYGLLCSLSWNGNIRHGKNLNNNVALVTICNRRDKVKQAQLSSDKPQRGFGFGFTLKMIWFYPKNVVKIGLLV